ncbi:MAG: transcriptional regulator [Epsilonproteobacteria bacterium]|nr:MAG: transcriptional regulator [Campylobacterota bacterium]
MLLTKKSEYALLAFVYISNKEAYISVDEVSKELNISKTYLAKILQNFTKHDILKSNKGKNGGFKLNKNAKNINIFDIINIAENKTASVFDCSANIQECNQKKQFCQIWPLLNNLQNKIDSFLKQLTLNDIK